MTKRVRASAIIIKNNQILLIKRHREQLDYWVFPGGGVEEGESPEEAAKREVYEETSLKVTKISGHSTYPDTENPECKHYFIICEVEDGYPTLGGPEKEINNPENHHEPVWVNINEALKLDVLYPIPIKNHLRDMQHETHRS